MSLFRLLAPHVCRAFAISDALDIRTLRSETLEATLDALATGVYLTARDGRVVYMNAAAERQVQRGNALSIVNNRLAPTDAEARATLRERISDAERGRTTEARDHSLALPQSDGVGYVATVLPLDRGDRYAYFRPFAAVAAVFVQDPTVAPPFPGEAFARLFGLTVAELRVTLALAPGLTLQEAADMLGIGLQTVKTHVQKIFQKTGVTRQSELVALIMRTSVPAASNGRQQDQSRLIGIGC